MSLYRSIFDAAGDGLIVADLETGRVVEANPAACNLHGYSRSDLIGSVVADLLHPDGRAAFAGQARALQPGGAFDMAAVHLRKDGTPFQVEAHWTALMYHGQPCILGVVRDISARVRAEQVLRQRVESHAREQATLLAISQALASTLELKPGSILDQLRMLIDYTQSALFTLEDSTLVALAIRGLQRPDGAAPLRLWLDDPQALAALSGNGRAILIADAWGDEPAAQALRALLGGQAAELLDGMRSWMWIPLAVQGRVTGGMSIAHADPGAFTAHHADLALTMANQAAISLANARLYEHAQALAKLQERQRLAQDLHDAVNQSLFSAGLIAEVLPRLWERDPQEGRRSLEDLRRLTRGALAEMRGLLAELRPAVLTGTELGDLLRQLGNALAGRANIPVAVIVQGQGVLPADVQLAFYRLCQEALSNIAKHAEAGQVEIHLQYDAGSVELHIRDDGRGFDPAHAPAGRAGLSMMRERAESIGARLSITSRTRERAESIGARPSITSLPREDAGADHGTEVSVRWSQALQPRTS
jgi:PAS domain S-box-containing protein